MVGLFMGVFLFRYRLPDRLEAGLRAPLTDLFPAFPERGWSLSSHEIPFVRSDIYSDCDLRRNFHFVCLVTRL